MDNLMEKQSITKEMDIDSAPSPPGVTGLIKPSEIPIMEIMLEQNASDTDSSPSPPSQPSQPILPGVSGASGGDVQTRLIKPSEIPLMEIMLEQNASDTDSSPSPPSQPSQPILPGVSGIGESRGVNGGGVPVVEITLTQDMSDSDSSPSPPSQPSQPGCSGASGVGYGGDVALVEIMLAEDTPDSDSSPCPPSVSGLGASRVRGAGDVQTRLRKPCEIPLVEIMLAQDTPEKTAPGPKKPGLFKVLASKLKRREKTVIYSPIQQMDMDLDLEMGPRSSNSNRPDYDSEDSEDYYSDHGPADKSQDFTASSSSLEDLFVPHNRRKARGMLARRGRIRKIFDSCKKNLVYSPQKLRRIRIILCVVGGIVLLALLATALYFIVNSSEIDSPADNNGAPSNGIHLEDILQGKLISRHFNGSWSTDNNIIYKENNAIMEFNVVTKQKTRLMLDTSQEYTSFEKSADGIYLLLAKNYKKNFRYSFYAEYDIYNIESGQIKPLEIQKDAKPLLLVQWAPVGNALVISYEHNLYYKPTPFADEIALTDDTNEAILNGVPDWVYEEEVFASNSAVWFSPDGKKLAFIQFDDTPTHVINFPIYGEAGDLRFQYPYNRLVAYPKAGSPNPRVKLFTSDLDRAAAGNTDHLTNIPVPSALNTESDYIISVVGWLNNTNVLSIWMNRIQNQAHMQVFNGLRRQNIYSLESKTGWIDFFAAPFKNRDGTKIAFIMPQEQESGGAYRHLCVLSTVTNSAKYEPLTTGKHIVSAILHWDSTHDLIFYSANLEEKPEQSHIYAIKAATGQTPKCITCNLIKSNGRVQTYYTAEFNNKNHVLINAVGPSIPQIVIYEWSYANNQITLNKLITWEDNELLRATISKYALPTYEIHTLPIADGFTAKVLLQLPPNMDRSGKTKYPMLVDVYGGPDSYSVIDRWLVDWGTYLTSNQSVIYAKIDGRGSGLRGEKLLHSVYLKLGTLEIADQIDVTRQLQKKFNFIDANHTGIWGWSYGGYAAAMALANDNEHVFHCAASIAPVTDWAYYDSIYTERYMGLPSINELGYSASRLSTKATQLRGKKFLLIHGTLDDNVHYQQAMILAKNLERHDILFKQISYPDEDHALGGVRPHLYHSLDRFFGECFANNRMTHGKWKN
ncbi:venom dipeptidyl peptidase 4 isoform X2 [Calliphora vicina]|uniref:venom dipeptidyl peptidase 4 isoform X2 n=1 Tax=Calliphora vicina TaxID=7373 RepID=UPI00325A494C